MFSTIISFYQVKIIFILEIYNLVIVYRLILVISLEFIIIMEFFGLKTVETFSIIL